MTLHRFASGTLALLLTASLGGCVTVCVGVPGPGPLPADGPPPGAGHGSAAGPDGGERRPPMHRHDPAFDAALQACASELGLPPPPQGGRPSRPPQAGADTETDTGTAGGASAPAARPAARMDFAKLDACLRGKGMAPPAHRGSAPASASLPAPPADR
ncbi:hypothetical protein JR065_15220 [Xanthomonas sp. AmX2]|uniref:hypothetical protein n=1 Tax=Xanthomonas sp. TaxID=29446 RepID=UPI00197FBB8D|nr:hypothetical protein [Xanthomonas sp.]MBN6151695.1 hypothetical protein [Xanthomonas sp.]